MSRPARMGLRFLIATLLTSMCLGMSPATAATSTLADGLIAYTRATSTPGKYVIRSVDPATGAETWLAQGTSPAWSPNGRRLAFVFQPNSDEGFIRIRNADGSVTITRVPAQPLSDTTTQGLDWSPDGTRVAFEYQGRIWVMNVARPHRPRAVSPHRGTAPSWSPDSRRIAYTGFAADGDADIHIVRADGTGHVNLTNNSSEVEYGAEWSPDGASFVFFSDSGEMGVWVIDADGTNDRIVASTFRDAPPTWSPTGTRIAFADEQGNVGTARAAGGVSSSLPTIGVALQLDWGPRFLR